MAVMEKARGEAQRRKRERRGGQLELLGAEQMHDPRHYGTLRERYVTAARAEVERLLQTASPVPYDGSWIAALSHPLVWESDLKAWIVEWDRAGRVDISGLEPRERVPKRGAGHQLLWRG